MDSEGGSTDTLLRCERHGVETRLRCAECETPVCPSCFVRTAVGFKCPTCAATAGGPRTYGVGGGRRTTIVVAVAVVALLVAGGAWVATRGGGGGGSPADVDGAEGKVVVPEMVLATGNLPGGLTWRLTGRRDGGVCTTLLVTPGPPAQERCVPATSRAVANLSTRGVPGPGGTWTYLTLGQVSDRTERVRVAPEGGAPWEVETVGGGTGLETRFFVAQMTANVAVSFTAVGADGAELGRVTRPALPPPPGS
jgi:hypothetical protein